MTHPRATTRRTFFRRSAGIAAAASAPYYVPATVFGNDDAPQNRIRMGAIGVGGMGQANVEAFLGESDVQVLAVCDVDRRRRQTAKEIVDRRYGNADCAEFADFREMLAQGNLDAVVVATPDHWHALASIAALDAGCDVYCEKPLAHSVAEGRAICDAVARNNRILQTGSHERSNDQVRRGCELVRSGVLGRVHTVHINMPTNDPHHQQVRSLSAVPPAQPVPPEFDYNFWLGPAPDAPYTPQRCHFFWRFILAYGGGEMTDRGAHIIDLAQLALGKDDAGPVEIHAQGVAPDESLYNAFFDYEFENVYDDGVRMLGSTKGPRGIQFVGEEGSLSIPIHFTGDAQLAAEPASLLTHEPADGVDLGRTTSHRRNFLDCVRSRETPFAPAEIGHRTATICHLNNIAMRVGRPLRWNPATEQIIDDPAAAALLTPHLREPWTL